MYNNYLYICKCKKEHKYFQNWFINCNCEYCIYTNPAVAHVRVRVGSNASIFYDFLEEHITYDFFNSYQFIFDEIKILKNNICFNSTEETIDYLIKYSKNIIFE